MMGGQRPQSGTTPLAKAVVTKRHLTAGERLRQQRADQRRRKAEQRDREQSDQRFAKSMGELAAIQSKLAKAKGSHMAAGRRDDRQRAIKLYKALRADLQALSGKTPADIVNAIENRLNRIRDDLDSLGVL